LQADKLSYYKNFTDKEPIGILYIDGNILATEDKKKGFTITAIAHDKLLLAVKLTPTGQEKM